MDFMSLSGVPRVFPCSCGSGESSYWLYDGNGIELCKACGSCEQEKLSGYKNEILHPYSENDVDELIEPS